MSYQIDWDAQWSAHSQYYREGYVHLDLSSFGAIPIRLMPGPGFGDLSHPTTRMVIALMAKRVPGKRILDIGCGSGILSLASVSLGAKEAVGIDIDNAAIIHARENGSLNQVEGKAQFMTTEEFLNISLNPQTILMNMISSEQEAVFHALPHLLHHPAEWIISGVLESQKIAYLNIAKARKWEFLEELREEGWLAMRFNSHN